jgi:hypothetical protein
MKDEAGLAAAAQQRFSEMDTDALNEMWANEGRADWAERALRLELLSRGVSELELDSVAQRRVDIAANAPPAARDTIWGYGVVGRMMTMASILLWVFAVHALGGAGIITAAGSIAILSLYIYILTRRVAAQKKHPATASALFAMNWQLVEAWCILVLAVILSAIVLLG